MADLEPASDRIWNHNDTVWFASRLRNLQRDYYRSAPPVRGPYFLDHRSFEVTGKDILDHEFCLQKTVIFLRYAASGAVQMCVYTSLAWQCRYPVAVHHLTFTLVSLIEHCTHSPCIIFEVQKSQSASLRIGSFPQSPALEYAAACDREFTSAQISTNPISVTAMRLVNTCENSTGPFKVEEFKDEHVPRYAILSHTWDEEEVSFQDMSDVNAMRKKGYKKIRDCCSVARKEGFDYVWIDTCCIDKTSSTELSEAINSMYRWYQDAHVCYAFLADVDWPTELASSRWFERGFTLQELIAPSTVVFYSRSWIELGTKESLKSQISDRTHIPIGVLSGADSVEDASVAQRMSWASSRKTSRLEDEAYCLMGIFGINMPLLYGEGKAVFLRLQEEIMKVSDDYSIFCWKSEHQGRGGILADSANAFSDSGDIVLTQDLLLMSKFPWTTTNKGVHLELAFMGIGHGCLGLGVLPCIRLDKRHMFLAIWLRDQSQTMERFERVRSHKLELIGLSFFVPLQLPLRQICLQRRRLAVTERRTEHLNLPYSTKDSNMDGDCYRSSHGHDLEWIDAWLGLSEYYLTNQTPILGKIRRVDCRDDFGSTGLFHAAATGNLEEVQQLLCRVKGNLQDADGRTPLSYAAAGGHSMTVWVMLLARYKAKANIPDKFGRTPLSYAAEGGHGDVVWLLLSLGDIVVHSPDNRGLTPLIYAARGGHEKIINMLLGRDGFQNYLKDNDGRTVLSHASEGGHVAAVRIFLTRTNAGPDMQDKYGKTPLLLASMNGHEEVTRALLAYGAEVETSTKFDETPLWVAALNGHEGIVRLLLPHNSSNVDWTDRNGRTLLHWAVTKGHVSVVRLLLDYGASRESRDRLGNTPIWTAVSDGNDAITQLLLGRGVTADRYDKCGWNVLHLAASKGHGPVVQLLLAHGVGVDSEKITGITPLWVAVRNAHEAVAQMLLLHGANIECRDAQKRTLLHRAVAGGHEAAVKLLLLHNVDLEATDCDDMPPLWHALTKMSQSSAKLLISRGANIDHRDKQGRTLLHRAVMERDETVVWLFLLYGASLEAKDCDDRTPLWHACLRKSEDIGCLLISKGANIELKDNQQRTLLHWAVLNRCPRIVKEILAGNASTDPKDDEGRTPLHWAVLKKNISIAMLLLDAGANPDQEDAFHKTPIRYAKESHDSVMISSFKRRGRTLPTHGKAKENTQKDTKAKLSSS